MCSESDELCVYLGTLLPLASLSFITLLLLLWVVYEKTTVVERDKISHGTGSVCRS